MKSEKKFQEVLRRRGERFFHNDEPAVANVAGDLQDVPEENGANVAIADSDIAPGEEASVQSSDDSAMCSDSIDDELENIVEEEPYVPRGMPNGNV